jgi:AGZA family xanthine/uracil permease-like MFS transporter
MYAILEKLFKINESGSNVRTEVLAGITTFLTMIYIIPLNGKIMKAALMNEGAVITATALITIIATIMNGLWSNTPIAMSVGLGLNSYFAYGLVGKLQLPWETALGIVFFSGIVFVLLTITNIRKLIIDSIPRELKIAISAGIGCFIAFIGLKQSGIIAAHKVTFVTVGNFGDKNVILALIGIFILFGLVIWKVRGAFIIGIIITSVIGFIIGVEKVPTSLLSMPASIAPIFGKLDIAGALKVSLIAPIITFMLTDLFDSLGTLSGVGFRAGLFDSENSKAVQRTLEVDATATVLGSVLGLSTTTSFIESAAGVEEGGRTGLTAVVTGLLFILTLFMLPLFLSIPDNAIYPVLIMVGIMMFTDLRNIDFSVPSIGIPAFVIILMMPLTFTITKGLCAGFIVYTFIKLISKEYKDINLVTVVMTVVSILAFIID